MEWGGETDERPLPSPSSLPSWLPWAELGRAEARSMEIPPVLPLGFREAQALDPSSSGAFPVTLARCWIWSVVAGTWTGAHKGCWHWCLITVPAPGISIHFCFFSLLLWFISGNFLRCIPQHFFFLYLITISIYSYESCYQHCTMNII